MVGAALVAAAAVVVGVGMLAFLCAKKPERRHTEVETGTVEMMDNPLRANKRASRGGAGRTQPNDDDNGVEVPRPRIRTDYDGRPIEERLGDLAEALNKDMGTTDDQPSARRLSVAKWSWPKTGQPMWHAPPPPTEPLTATETPGWSKTKESTERKLFGDLGGDPGADSLTSSLQVKASGADSDSYILVDDDDGFEHVDPDLTTPKKQTARRGSVYGFEDGNDVAASHGSPTLPPPPPPPPAEETRKDSAQWEEMDFSAKRNKLGASINLGGMLPGAKPTVGLRKSAYIDHDVDDDEVDLQREAQPKNNETDGSNDQPLTSRLNNLLAQGPPPKKSATHSTDPSPTIQINDDDDDAFNGFDGVDEPGFSTPPTSPTPSAKSLKEFDEVSHMDTLKRVRRPTGPRGRKLPTPNRHSRHISDVSISDLPESAVA